MGVVVVLVALLLVALQASCDGGMLVQHRLPKTRGKRETVRPAVEESSSKHTYSAI